MENDNKNIIPEYSEESLNDFFSAESQNFNLAEGNDSLIIGDLKFKLIKQI